MLATATLGMHEEQFTMLAGEVPGPVPTDTVAGIRTHDMDPFAVAQCCSVVHGKLVYEGKLVAAVLDAKLGVRLTYANLTGEFA